MPIPLAALALNPLTRLHHLDVNNLYGISGTCARQDDAKISESVINDVLININSIQSTANSLPLILQTSNSENFLVSILKKYGVTVETKPRSRGLSSKVLEPPVLCIKEVSTILCLLSDNDIIGVGNHSIRQNAHTLKSELATASITSLNYEEHSRTSSNPDMPVTSSRDVNIHGLESIGEVHRELQRAKRIVERIHDTPEWFSSLSSCHSACYNFVSCLSQGSFSAVDTETTTACAVIYISIVSSAYSLVLQVDNANESILNAASKIFLIDNPAVALGCLSRKLKLLLVCLLCDYMINYRLIVSHITQLLLKEYKEAFLSTSIYLLTTSLSGHLTAPNDEATSVDLFRAETHQFFESLSTFLFTCQRYCFQERILRLTDKSPVLFEVDELHRLFSAIVCYCSTSDLSGPTKRAEQCLDSTIVLMADRLYREAILASDKSGASNLADSYFEVFLQEIDHILHGTCSSTFHIYDSVLLPVINGFFIFLDSFVKESSRAPANDGALSPLDCYTGISLLLLSMSEFLRKLFDAALETLTIDENSTDAELRPGSPIFGAPKSDTSVTETESPSCPSSTHDFIVGNQEAKGTAIASKIEMQPLASPALSAAQSVTYGQPNNTQAALTLIMDALTFCLTVNKSHLIQELNAYLSIPQLLQYIIQYSIVAPLTSLCISKIHSSMLPGSQTKTRLSQGNPAYIKSLIGILKAIESLETSARGCMHFPSAIELDSVLTTLSGEYSCQLCPSCLGAITNGVVALEPATTELKLACFFCTNIHAKNSSKMSKKTQSLLRIFSLIARIHCHNSSQNDASLVLLFSVFDQDLFSLDTQAVNIIRLQHEFFQNSSKQFGAPVDPSRQQLIKRFLLACLIKHTMYDAFSLRLKDSLSLCVAIPRVYDYIISHSKVMQLQVSAFRALVQSGVALSGHCRKFSDCFIDADIAILRTVQFLIGKSIQACIGSPSPSLQQISLSALTELHSDEYIANYLSNPLLLEPVIQQLSRLFLYERSPSVLRTALSLYLRRLLQPLFTYAVFLTSVAEDNCLYRLLASPLDTLFTLLNTTKDGVRKRICTSALSEFLSVGATLGSIASEFELLSDNFSTGPPDIPALLSSLTEHYRASSASRIQGFSDALSLMSSCFMLHYLGSRFTPGNLDVDILAGCSLVRVFGAGSQAINDILLHTKQCLPKNAFLRRLFLSLLEFLRVILGALKKDICGLGRNKDEQSRFQFNTREPEKLCYMIQAFLCELSSLLHHETAIFKLPADSPARLPSVDPQFSTLVGAIMDTLSSTADFVGDESSNLLSIMKLPSKSPLSATITVTKKIRRRRPMSDDAAENIPVGRLAEFMETSTDCCLVVINSGGFALLCEAISCLAAFSTVEARRIFAAKPATSLYKLCSLYVTLNIRVRDVYGRQTVEPPSATSGPPSLLLALSITARSLLQLGNITLLRTTFAKILDVSDVDCLDSDYLDPGLATLRLFMLFRKSDPLKVLSIQSSLCLYQLLEGYPSALSGETYMPEYRELTDIILADINFPVLHSAILSALLSAFNLLRSDIFPSPNSIESSPRSSPSLSSTLATEAERVNKMKSFVQLNHDIVSILSNLYTYANMEVVYLGGRYHMSKVTLDQPKPVLLLVSYLSRTIVSGFILPNQAIHPVLLLLLSVPSEDVRAECLQSIYHAFNRYGRSAVIAQLSHGIASCFSLKSINIVFCLTKFLNLLTDSLTNPSSAAAPHLFLIDENVYRSILNLFTIRTDLLVDLILTIQAASNCTEAKKRLDSASLVDSIVSSLEMSRIYASVDQDVMRCLDSNYGKDIVFVVFEIFRIRYLICALLHYPYHLTADLRSAQAVIRRFTESLRLDYLDELMSHLRCDSGNCSFETLSVDSNAWHSTLTTVIRAMYALVFEVLSTEFLSIYSLSHDQKSEKCSGCKKFNEKALNKTINHIDTLFGVLINSLVIGSTLYEMQPHNDSIKKLGNYLSISMTRLVKDPYLATFLSHKNNF